MLSGIWMWKLYPLGIMNKSMAIKIQFRFKIYEHCQNKAYYLMLDVDIIFFEAYKKELKSD